MKSFINKFIIILLLFPSLIVYGKDTGSDPIDSLINTVKNQIAQNSKSETKQEQYLINYSNQNVVPGIYTNFVNSGSSIWNWNTTETQNINAKINSIQPLLNGAKYYVIVASIYNYADLEDVESFSNNHDWNTVGTVLHKNRTASNSGVDYRYGNTMNGGAKPSDVEASYIISRSILKKLNRESFGEKVYLQFFITCYTYNKKNKVGSKYTISHTMLGSLSKDILGTPQFRELHYALRSSDNAKAFANCTTPELRKQWLNGWLDVVYNYFQKNKPQLTPGADALSGKQLNFTSSVIDGTVRNTAARAFTETELNSIRHIIDEVNKNSTTKFKTVIVNEDDPELAKIKEQAIKSANKLGEEAFIVFAKRKPNELLEFFEYIVPDAWKREGPQYNDGCNTEVFNKANAAMQQYLSLRPGNKAEAYLYGTYKLIFESLKCMFSENNCGSSSAFSFVCGAFNAAVESVDIIGGIEGLTELATEAAKGAIKNRIEFVRDVWDLTRNFNKYATAWPGNIEEIAEKLRPPYIRDVLGVSQFVKKTFDHFKTYFVTDGNMYRYGQATVYVGTIVFMAGKPLLNLIPKLRAAKLGTNIEVVVNTLHDAEKAGHAILKSSDETVIFRENEVVTIKEQKTTDPNFESSWTTEAKSLENDYTSNPHHFEEITEKPDIDCQPYEINAKDQIEAVDDAIQVTTQQSQVDIKYIQTCQIKRAGKGRPTKDWRNQTIGKLQVSNDAKNVVCTNLENNAKVLDGSIRVNQAQIDINGLALGKNQPDIQFTYSMPDGTQHRFYIEIDNPPYTRANNHYNRIITNEKAANYNWQILNFDNLPNDLKNLEFNIKLSDGTFKVFKLEGSVTLIKL